MRYRIYDKLLRAVSMPFFYAGWAWECISLSFLGGRACFEDDAFDIMAMAEAEDDAEAE